MEKIAIYKERQFCYTWLVEIFDSPLYSLDILLLHLLLILPWKYIFIFQTLFATFESVLNSHTDCLLTNLPLFSTEW